MEVHHAIIVAVVVATIVFAGLAAVTLASSTSLSPEYFDTAGKYIHRL